MRKNVVFIGFMAVGKTSVAKVVARRLGKEYVSTDELIVSKVNKSVSRIFEDEGEAFFRQLEREVVKETSQMRNVVIDCGGGVILCEENVKALKSNGIIFFLYATPETIFERGLNELGARPLLGNTFTIEDVKRLLARRMPLYLDAADYIVDTTECSVEVVADKIVNVLKGDGIL
ncbi:MAG: shikimate kinase [Nitrososphaeria archaeon]|nr:shikimate kinase [Nitrososphaeria archaeon]